MLDFYLPHLLMKSYEIVWFRLFDDAFLSKYVLVRHVKTERLTLKQLESMTSI
ncbi:Uncharacterised protein [Mycobacteroides abscessus subsp. massiliense]|nr:Uncharacterised protein [Mycobacteroides abscessus subsp. massiliense]